jgi:hypothetical protein
MRKLTKMVHLETDEKKLARGEKPEKQLPKFLLLSVGRREKSFRYYSKHK